MKSTTNSNDYVLGHSDAELKRLEAQAKIFDDDTGVFLRLAGIGNGMRVLDIGCGVGDVSIIAGRLVGESGSVLGLDQSAGALEVARRRTQAESLGMVHFACQDLNHIGDHKGFDAIIGRFILLHFPDPIAVVRGMARHLRPGGILAFAEMDISSVIVAPPMPSLQKCLGWVTALYERSGLDPDMGSKLYATFRAAGLQPDLSAACRIEAGSNAHGLRYVVETLRSMRPALLALGIADENELNVEQIAKVLATDVEAGDHCVIYPRLVGASARVA